MFAIHGISGRQTSLRTARQIIPAIMRLTWIADCHTSNAEVVPWPFPAYQPDCAGCRANDYEPDEHTKFDNVDYTVDELRDCASACHEYTDSSLTTIEEFRPGPEHTVNQNSFD